MKIFRLLTIIITTLLLATPYSLCQIDKEDPKDDQQWIKPAPLSNARLSFDHTTYDFGSIAKGSIVTHNYWLVNTGTDTLVITKIKPTCGCTSTRKAGFSVAPGDKTTIDIVFDSGKFNGRVTKSIKIECNDSVNPYLDLRFKAVINNPLQILEYSPLQINFGIVPVGALAEITVNLTNVDATESKIVIVEKPSENFIKTTLDKTKLKPDATTELKLTLTKDMEPGKFLTSISLEIEDKPKSRITIPISGTVDE